MAKKTDKITENEIENDMESIQAEFTKLFGKKSLKLATDTDKATGVVPFDSIVLDSILGIGGLPFGRIVELIGWESSGKTTLQLEIISNAMKQDKKCRCAFIDMEHALDVDYAAKIGVDLSRLYVVEPDNGEEAFDMAYKLIESAKFAVVALDSIASTIPKASQEDEMDKSKMTKHARLVNTGIEKIFVIVKKTNTLLLLTNQFREKVGVMFGSPDVTKGGNAPKFYSSIRLDISRSTTKANSVVDSKTGENISNLTTIKVIKNKMAPPQRKGQVHIRFGEGIDRIKETIDLALEYDVLTKSAGFYIYKVDKLVKGEEELREFLLDNSDLYLEIRDHVKKLYKGEITEIISEEINIDEIQ